MRAYLFLAQVVVAYTAAAQPLASTPFELVNTPYDELNPVISPDGQSLYITVANHPQNVGGRKDPGDIWIAQRNENNTWSAPVHGGGQLNDRAYNGVAGFSPDGQSLYLLSHYDHRSAAAARTQGISVARRSGSGWSTPENITIPYFQNKSGQLSGALSADGTVFVFAAETYGTRGVEDLYVTVKAGGGWSEPKNLGSVVNTPFQELSPFLAADGKTLYFSSNGRKGSGSFDIYKTERLDESWTNWSAPENLGAQVNTTGRELYYRLYPQQGYSLYSSTTNSDGYGDVKQYRPDDMPPPAPIDSVAAPVATASVRMDTTLNSAAPVNDNLVTVHGKVVNARTGEGVTASLIFTGASGLSIPLKTFPEKGYELRIVSTGQYIVKIEAPGFISTLEKLDVQTFEMKDLELNFRLQPIEVGTTVSLRNVLFEQSRTELLPDSYEELNLVVAFLQTNDRVRIELSGHTDNRGIPGQNVKLSQARVDKVKAYLVSKGIAAKRIEGKGYGGSKPIASNDSEETRHLNRRVEFTIKKS